MRPVCAHELTQPLCSSIRRRVYRWSRAGGLQGAAFSWSVCQDGPVCRKTLPVCPPVDRGHVLAGAEAHHRTGPTVERACKKRDESA